MAVNLWTPRCYIYRYACQLHNFRPLYLAIIQQLRACERNREYKEKLRMYKRRASKKNDGFYVETKGQAWQVRADFLKKTEIIEAAK